MGATKSSKLKSNRKALIIVCLCGVAVAAAWFVFISMRTLTDRQAVNYAKDVAKPIEAALAQADGVKKCSYGDGGWGADNDMPWYYAFYELPANYMKAAELVSGIAKDNGYKITRQDKGYFAAKSKTSPVGDHTGLEFYIGNDGERKLSNISCGTNDTVVLHGDENTSVITLSVKLIDVKN